jgi:hypothetical protein
MPMSLEAARNGVLSAILELHERKVFTKIIRELLHNVKPRLEAPNQPSPGVTVNGRTSYVLASEARRKSRLEYESALNSWARSFRLTDDLTRTGACPAWILKWAEARCDGRDFPMTERGNWKKILVPPPSVPGRLWVSVPVRRKGENFIAWLKRAKPDLRHASSAAQTEPRGAAKGNSDHFEWFVLSNCAGWTAPQIVGRLGTKVAEDAIRKGASAVRCKLGIKRVSANDVDPAFDPYRSTRK